MSNEEKIILMDSLESATSVMKQVWLSANGDYFLSESAARFFGATHKECNSCYDLIKSNDYPSCESCRKKYELERYDKLEKKEWDYETPLKCFLTETYFYSIDDIVDYLEMNEESTIDNLMLVWCQPVSFPEIEPNLIFEEYVPCDLHFDDVASKELQIAIECLNKIIKAHIPISWISSNIAAIISTEDK